jgi:L-malate glycosyltransferase
MKIGITCYPGIGGSGILATDLGISLARRGHEIHFITSSPPVKLGNKHHENIHFHRVEDWNYPVFKEPPYTLSLAAKMAEIAKKVSLDILHVHYAIPHAASAYIAKQMLSEEGITLKTITTLHGTDVTIVGSEPSFIPITDFFINKSDGITAVSKHLRDETCKIFNVKKDIEVIYNFVNTKKFKPMKNMELRRRFAPDDHRIMIHLSNYRPVKRILDTIRVFDRVRKEIPAVLLMPGEGMEHGKAVDLSNSLGLSEHVRFIGVQESVEELLAISDLFIINSEKESFGLAVLEAASCGVPSVVTDAGGLPEVVVDGETGFISPVGNTEHMASQAIKILENPGLLNRMSESCRRRAVEKFDTELIIPLYEKYYRQLRQTENE